MTKILINVTKEHIDKGYPRNKDKCALALAFTEAIGQPVKVGVMEAWSLKVGGYASLPEVARVFRQEFDQFHSPSSNRDLEPFSFEVEWDERNRVS